MIILRPQGSAALFSSGILARQIGKGKILPRHVLLAVKNDVELDKLLKGCILHCGGIKPHIEAALLKNEDYEEDES